MCCVGVGGGSGRKKASVPSLPMFDFRWFAGWTKDDLECEHDREGDGGKECESHD